MPHSILIVSHCYSAQLTHYASALKYQLSSIVFYSPQDTRIVVCYTPEDERTVEVMKYFTDLSSKIQGLPLPLEELGRRAIGRNLAALRSKEDLVWFTDCDIVFGVSCLRELSILEWPPGAAIIYPRHHHIHRNHQIGDRVLKEAVGRMELLSVLPDEFMLRALPRAIGPVQIVQGEFARCHGYLDGTKWQLMFNAKSPFSDFRDDVAFRRFCKEKGKMARIELPNLYRIRHSQTTHPSEVNRPWRDI